MLIKSLQDGVIVISDLSWDMEGIREAFKDQWSRILGLFPLHSLHRVIPVAFSFIIEEQSDVGVNLDNQVLLEHPNNDPGQELDVSWIHDGSCPLSYGSWQGKHGQARHYVFPRKLLIEPLNHNWVEEALDLR